MDSKMMKMDQRKSVFDKNMEETKVEFNFDNAEEKVNYAYTVTQEPLQKKKSVHQENDYPGDTLKSYEIDTLNFSNQNTVPLNYSIKKEDHALNENSEYEYTKFDFTNNSIYKNKGLSKEIQEQEEFPSDFENLEEYISEGEQEEEVTSEPKIDGRCKRVKKYKEKL